MRSATLALAVCLLAGGAALAGCSIDDPYTGQPFTRTERILIRRESPTQEERNTRPPPPYEDVLRAELAEKDRLEIPRDLHESTQFIDGTRRATASAVGPGFGPAHDPWMSYEDDRRHVLVREWADTGKPEPSTAEPKVERPVEDDPFAPAVKVGKKEAPAEGDDKKPEGDDKKPEGDDKKPEGDKKGD